MSGVDVLARFTPTPEALAAAFWEMDAEQQADFFAALDRMAGIHLCSQMAGVVDVIRRRSEAGDHGSMNGFRTMLAHSQDYHEAATEIRMWEALRAIAKLADHAQGGQP